LTGRVGFGTKHSDFKHPGVVRVNLSQGRLMQFNLANILVFIGLALGFLIATLTIGKILRPATPTPEKAEIYECGEHAVSQAWFNFNPRFYIIALVFLIFDVEVAFTYPVATVFRRWVASGAGWFAFGELLLFVAILVLGLAYVWRKGDLEWIRKVVVIDQKQAATSSTAPPATPDSETKKKAA
jgi:NADH-quinone oxidoreductase subunit A